MQCKGRYFSFGLVLRNFRQRLSALALTSNALLRDCFSQETTNPNLFTGRRSDYWQPHYKVTRFSILKRNEKYWQPLHAIDSKILFLLFLNLWLEIKNITSFIFESVVENIKCFIFYFILYSTTYHNGMGYYSKTQLLKNS